MHLFSYSLMYYLTLLCQVSEETEEAKQRADCAIKALVIELKREMDDIQELR